MPSAKIRALHTPFKFSTYLGGRKLRVCIRRDMQKKKRKPFGKQAGFKLCISGYASGACSNAEFPESSNKVFGKLVCKPLGWKGEGGYRRHVWYSLE